MSKKIILLFMAIVGFYVAAQTGIDPSVEVREFRNKEIEYKKRFEGFYIFQNAQKRRRIKRRKGAEAHKKQRNAREAAREKARQEFVKNRKQKKRATDEKWLVEIKRREELHEKKRREFVKRRNRLIRLKAKSMQIPEEEEMGL